LLIKYLIITYFKLLVLLTITTLY